MDLKTMYKHHQMIWAGAVAGEFASDAGKGIYAKRLGFDDINGCAACQYVWTHFPEKFHGEECFTVCPLKWSGGSHCNADNAEYRKWLINPTPENALAVMNVPLRECESKPKRTYPYYGKTADGLVVRFDRPGCVTVVKRGSQGIMFPKGYSVEDWAENEFTPCDPPEQTFKIGDTFSCYGYRYVIAMWELEPDSFICINPETGYPKSGIQYTKDITNIKESEIKTDYPIEKLEGEWRWHPRKQKC